MKWLPENIKGIMAFTVVFLSFCYFFIITLLDVKANDQVIIAIVAAMSNVLQYYFGSSQGSNKKDELINSLSNQTTVTTTEVTSDSTKITQEPVQNEKQTN